MINPIILLLGSGTFIIALAIHIIVWRAMRPSKHLFCLGIIFLILPSLAYSLLYLFQTSAYLSKYLTSPFNITFSFLWHFSLSSVYIASYPLFQAECPSLKIVLAVSSSMPRGMTGESIDKLFSQETLLQERLKDLANDRLIILKNDNYVISAKGRLLSVFFLAYRSLLGLPLGEG
jgi:hypothetical protein